MRLPLATNKKTNTLFFALLSCAMLCGFSNTTVAATVSDATNDALSTAIKGTTKEALDALTSSQDSRAEEEERRKEYLGSLQDPQSIINKANKLAEKARKQRELFGTDTVFDDSGLDETVPPPNLSFLQSINETNGGKSFSIADDPINKKISIDMRMEAQKEAALSYGARGGLAKRSYQIMEKMKSFEPVLDSVFDFRSLLIKAPSGLLIEPPIIQESLDALIITNEGKEAAMAKGVFDINKNAKIVSAPRNWRQYLIQSWSDVPPPPKILWPKNEKEQRNWNEWIQKGWKVGVEQAEQIFNLNTNRLTADYDGMVRYRVLLAQGMVSAPFALHEQRGVTGNKNQMRIGDSALRITGPSHFLTGANKWNPADR